MEPESFVLRRYSPARQCNLVVDQFTLLDDQCYGVVLEAGEHGLYQVYPGDPTKSLYRPLPAGCSWFAFLRLGGTTGPLKRAARIDSHDQYGYFNVPLSTEPHHVYWVLAANHEEALQRLAVKQ